MADQHESDMVEVVNKVNRGTKLIPRVDLDVFLRKHTLYQVIQESPTVEPKRKGRKPGKKAAPVVKDIEKKRRGRKPKGMDASGRSSPQSSPSESVTDARKRKLDKVRGSADGDAPGTTTVSSKASTVLTVNLQEMHEIVRLFTSSPPGCVDWAMIATNVTGGRISPGDVEFMANEFLPHVHYRPSLGLIVMERQSKIPSDYQKHRQTMKRMKQGLAPMVEKLKSEFDTVDTAMATDHMDHSDQPTGSPESPDTSALITPEASPAKPAPGGRRADINSYVSSMPRDLVEELRARAATAMARFEKGDVPIYAMRTAPTASLDGEAGTLTATGRIRKRYETKAMRLAKQAAEEAAGDKEVKIEQAAAPVRQVMGPLSATTTTAFTPPPFFHQAARQFIRSGSGGSAAGSADDNTAAE